MFSARGIPAGDLANNLEILREALRRDPPGQPGEVACGYVDAGPAGARRAPRNPEPLARGSARTTCRGAIYAVLLDGQRHMASRLIQRSVEEGASVRDVYLYVFQRTSTRSAVSGRPTG